ncbi:TRAP transporter large permease [Xanthobacteraceae bacterium Astr-EGSB]|nr:TRAP transporter large permease [Xanthobacteraceae bacterium Astr-EGSB]
MTAHFVWIFLVITLLGVPIAFAMAAGPIVGFLLSGHAGFLQILPQRLISGISQFSLLAIPLFILAGEIMNTGGITQRLVNVADAFVGHLRGGLAQVNIVSNVLFAGLSGSAAADASALGSVLIPAMEREGYTRRFAAAVTAASAILGPIIPPSIMMVIYAFVMQLSVAALFLTGFVPGIMIGGGLMLATRLLANRRGFPQRKPRASFRTVVRATWAGALPLLTPLIILGGIVGGICSPTEAAAVAVVYAAFISLFIFKTIGLKDLYDALRRSMITSAGILLIISTAALFGWAMTLSGLPRELASLIIGMADNRYVVLALLNVFLLIVGMFLDAGPAILIIGPILAPTIAHFGIDPLHFAIVMCVNLSIGLATPPVGLVLFVTSSVSKISVVEIVREMLPYYLVHIVVILLITYIPALTLTLPRLAGF